MCRSISTHTCTPGYGLASSLVAIINGVDILDTNIWWFGEGSAAPAIELIYIFCQKLGIELGANMEAVGKIRNELYDVRKQLAAFDLNKDHFPKAFDPLADKLPAEIDALFDRAIAAAEANDEESLLAACHAIEDYFGFPKPNLLVKDAEVPGGMYSNMVAQLKALGASDLLDDAMRLIPKGAPRCRPCATCDSYQPDCRQPGCKCGPRPQEGKSRLQQSFKPVYLVGKGRIRPHSGSRRPRIPREDCRNSCRDSLRCDKIPKARKSCA